MDIYYKKQKLYNKWIFIGVVLLLVNSVYYLLTGPLTADIDSIIRCVNDKDFFRLVWLNRGPRLIGALSVGASLSVSGLIYQELFGNRMASPDLLGVSQGAAVGSSIAIVMNTSIIMMQMLAFCGGIFSVIITYFLSKVFSTSDKKLSLILSGIIVSGLMNSILGFIKYSADDSNLSTITYWLLGSFSRINEKTVFVGSVIIIICLSVLYIMRWRIALLKNGDEDAQTHGVNVKLVYCIAIICSTLSTSISVSLSGIVGFVGLAIPNLFMLVSKYDIKSAMPLSVVYGMLFMSVCDLLSRTVANTEIPVGIITSGIGSIIFIGVSLMNNSGGKKHA